MFFRTLCPTVMLASVHSGIASPSIYGQSVVVKKKSLDEDEEKRKEDEGEDKENSSSPRKSNEDSKPVLRSKKTTKKDDGEDKENRPCLTVRANNKIVSPPKFAEVNRSRRYGDNKPVGIPNRCLSPSPVQKRVWAGPRAFPLRAPGSPMPLRVIAPTSNVQNERRCASAPAAGLQGDSMSPRLRSSRSVHQKQHSSLPLRITDSSLTLNPNFMLSIACRNDRIFWVTKEIDSVKGY